MTHPYGFNRGVPPHIKEVNCDEIYWFRLNFSIMPERKSFRAYSAVLYLDPRMKIYIQVTLQIHFLTWSAREVHVKRNRVYIEGDVVDSVTIHSQGKKVLTKRLGDNLYRPR
jgi:hypothetical protein